MSAGGRAPVRLGVLGCGTVGSAFVRLVTGGAAAIEARTGMALEITRVGVRNLSAERDVELEPAVFTRDTHAIVTDPAVDLVVETIGGIEPARHLVLAALAAGKPVVTANKELVANCGEDLFPAAERACVDLHFEGAVAGGIPVVRVLRESLVGEPIHRIIGIVNGTTNYILTKMTSEGAAYGDVLAEAQRLGYAEADPSADVEGFDAGAKAAIMATIAFGARVVAGDVYSEGIAHITQSDIDAAGRMGHVIKLLAIVERVDGEIAVRVHPAMVPSDHPLASVRDSFNAVFVQGGAVDDLMLYGRGAGGMPTASAMVGDTIAAAADLRRGTHRGLGLLADIPLRPIDETDSAFYVQLDVDDRPGVLAEVAGLFGGHGVSIRSMEQEGRGDEARLMFITHEAREADMESTLRDLRHLEPVRRVGNRIRVIES